MSLASLATNCESPRQVHVASFGAQSSTIAVSQGSTGRLCFLERHDAEVAPVNELEVPRGVALVSSIATSDGDGRFVISLGNGNVKLIAKDDVAHRNNVPFVMLPYVLRDDVPWVATCRGGSHQTLTVSRQDGCVALVRVDSDRGITTSSKAKVENAASQPLSQLHPATGDENTYFARLHHTVLSYDSRGPVWKASSIWRWDPFDPLVGTVVEGVAILAATEGGALVLWDARKPGLPTAQLSRPQKLSYSAVVSLGPAFITSSFDGQLTSWRRGNDVTQGFPLRSTQYQLPNSLDTPIVCLGSDGSTAAAVTERGVVYATSH